MRRLWNEVLTFLAIAFLIAFSYPAFNENVSTGRQSLIDVVQWVCWVAFAADLVYGIWNAESKFAYLKIHPLEVMSVVLPSAVQITIAERGAEGSNIKDFGDGIWWAFTTVTTVGYGDRFPITGEGRFLAVLLMIMGISLVGVITASVASWFVKMSNNETTKPPL